MPTIEGTYYKTITRNILTGQTVFLITPTKGITSKTGVIRCIGNIGVFASGMPVALDGYMTGEEFIVNRCGILTGSFDQVARILTFVDESIADSKKEKIAEVVGNDIIKYIKNSGDKQPIFDCLISRKAQESVREGRADEKVIAQYNNSLSILNKIYTKINNILNQEDMTRKLLSFGVDIGKIEVLCKKGITMDDLRRNPYIPLLKFGISISACEMFGKECGIGEYDIRRLCGFTYDALDFAKKNGHTCVELTKLLEIVNYRVDRYSASDSEKDVFSRSLLYYCIKKLEKLMMCYVHNNKIYVYFNTIFEEEQKIISNIRRLEEGKKKITPSKSIEEIEKKLNITYNEEQKIAFNALKTSGIKILTGPPGSGKTSVIKGLMEYYGKPCHLSATTGMAAQVMQGFCEKTAETVHRMLNITPFNDKLIGKSLNDPVEEEFVVVDEVSMMGVKLFSALLSGIKSGSILLLVGDEDQLESVEYGNILHDLIASGKIEVYRLKHVLRQSGTIFENAVSINKKNTQLTCDSQFIIKSFSDDMSAVNCLKDCITPNSTVLSPIKAYTKYGTEYLNQVIQSNDNMVLMSYGSTSYRLHDKVVMTENNYEKGYVNGDLGEIIGIDNGRLVVRFSDGERIIDREDMADMDLAYALTIHRAQGSGFDEVHIMLQDGSQTMMTKRLLYTSVTRAKKKVVIYSVNSAVTKAILNTRESTRTSLLCDLLQENL